MCTDDVLGDTTVKLSAVPTMGLRSFMSLRCQLVSLLAPEELCAPSWFQLSSSEHLEPHGADMAFLRIGWKEGALLGCWSREI